MKLDSAIGKTRTLREIRENPDGSLEIEFSQDELVSTWRWWPPGWVDTQDRGVVVAVGRPSSKGIGSWRRAESDAPVSRLTCIWLDCEARRYLTTARERRLGRYERYTTKLDRRRPDPGGVGRPGDADPCANQPARPGSD